MKMTGTLKWAQTESEGDITQDRYHLIIIMRTVRRESSTHLMPMVRKTLINHPIIIPCKVNRRVLLMGQLQ